VTSWSNGTAILLTIITNSHEIGQQDLCRRPPRPGRFGALAPAYRRRLQQHRHANTRRAGPDNQQSVKQFFEAERPEYVFLAAAKVGGIHANNTYRADFIYQNLMIESNIIHASYRQGVKSSCSSDRAVFTPNFRPSHERGASVTVSSNRPTNLMPSPKLPVSRCAMPTTGSMEQILSAPCRPIFTARG